jgi:hypothetical protein
MAKTWHFTNHPGWVSNLCTFALWQQLSVCTRQSAFLLNQSKKENEIRTVGRLTGIA